jgi:hypothetical protein
MLNVGLMTAMKWKVADTPGSFVLGDVRGISMEKSILKIGVKEGL